MSPRDPHIGALIFDDARKRFLRAFAEYIADRSVSDSEKRDETRGTVSAIEQMMTLGATDG